MSKKPRPKEGCVWITGASAGIGRGVALEFARRGWRVAASARRAEELDALRQAASQRRGEVIPYPLDVTDAGAVSAVAKQIEQEQNGVAIAILNAGTSLPFRPENLNLDNLQRQLDLNVMGVARCLSAVAPAMMERRRGKIGVVASVAGYRGLPTAAAYGLTKAGLINFAESLQVDFERYDVQIQLINPGFVKTPLTDKNDFPMPFLMSQEAAARRIYSGVMSNRFEITFPKRLAWPLKVLRCAPYPLAFSITRRLLPK